MPQEALLRLPLELRNACGKALPDNCFEIARGGMPFGDFELRERIGDALDLDVAARSDVHGAAQRFRKLAENMGHFRRALEVELVGLELHAVRVAHGLAGLDAQEHVLRVSVVMVEVMSIVGGNQWDTSLFRKPNQFAVDILFDRQSLILNFEKEIAFAEDIAQTIGILARLIVLLIDDRFGHRAAKTGGKRNQSFAVFRKQIVVNARAIIETFEETSGN